VRRVIVLVIGSTLIGIGLVLIVLPGPFTLPFVIAGLILLAGEFVWAERLLEKTKNQVKKIDPRKLGKKKKKQ
jgi:uncharacterized membrane protein YbaN (DUF454 family)